jgi:hypothetical protein
MRRRVIFMFSYFLFCAASLQDLLLAHDTHLHVTFFSIKYITLGVVSVVQLSRPPQG